MEVVRQSWPIKYLGFGGPTEQARQHTLDLRVAKEAAVSIGATAAAFAMNLVLAQYVVLPLGITMFSWLVTGALFYSVAGAADYGMRRLSGAQTESSCSSTDKMTSVAALSAIHLLGQAGPHAFVHEAGHVLASMLLIKDSHPRMDVRSFAKSTTTFFDTRQWTYLGGMLGPQASFALIAVAGVVASVALCMLLTTVAHFVRKSHPQVAQIIEFWGVSQLITDVAYGVLTVVGSRKTIGSDNDFLVLQQASGISPLYTLSGMVLVPVVYRLGLAALEWHQERMRARAEAETSFSMWRPTTWTRLFSSASS